MNDVLLLKDGEFPTCANCIYRSLINSIFYCSRKSPFRKDEPYSLATENKTWTTWPTVSVVTTCGEGLWVNLSLPDKTLLYVTYDDAYLSWFEANYNN